MSAVWGIDLGVRSLYVARIEDGALDLYSHGLKIHKQSRGEELSELSYWLTHTLGEGQVWIEEPPLAGPRNLQTFLHLSQTSGVVGAVAGPNARYIQVSSWKHGTVGNGSASKELVANWLRRSFPQWHKACEGDQNYIDATCIALYGLTQKGMAVR